MSANLRLLKKFVTYPDGDSHKDNCPTYKSQAEHPGIGATIEVCSFLDIADSLELFLLVSEQVVYPLLVLVKGSLEGRNGGVVPHVQLGKSFIVDTYFEVALFCLDNSIADSVNDILRTLLDSHKSGFC